jgi:hypothetical protein
MAFGMGQNLHLVLCDMEGLDQAPWPVNCSAPASPNNKGMVWYTW